MLNRSDTKETRFSISGFLDFGTKIQTHQVTLRLYNKREDFLDLKVRMPYLNFINHVRSYTQNTETETTARTITETL